MSEHGSRAIHKALQATNGKVTDEVLEVAFAAYPTKGDGQARKGAIAFPYLESAGAVAWAEGGVVGGHAAYVTMYADGAWGALMGTDGKALKTWRFTGKGARAQAWAAYRDARSHISFMPKDGELVKSGPHTIAPAETDLYVYVKAGGRKAAVAQ